MLHIFKDGSPVQRCSSCSRPWQFGRWRRWWPSSSFRLLKVGCQWFWKKYGNNHNLIEINQNTWKIYFFISKNLPRVRIELTAFRLWDWRAAYCATKASYESQLARCKNKIENIAVIHKLRCLTEQIASLITSQ